MKKLVTIIGSGKGISHRVAEKFGSEGFKVALIARTESKFQEQVNQLSEKGIEALYAVADVADADSLKNALYSTRDKEGHAEVILYNAATVSVMDILEQNWETIKQTHDITVGGYFNLMKMVLPSHLSKIKKI